MITDWQIQNFSRTCAHSEKTFQPGDRVLCLLVDHFTEGLGRLDVLEEYENDIKTEGEIVGRWVKVIKPPEKGNAEDKKQEAQSVEELFISMVESVEVSIRSNSSKCMIFILALFLERKRMLKSVATKGIPQNYTNYRHMKSKVEYLVEQVEMTPENIAHIENNLSILTGNPDSEETSPAEKKE